MIGSYSHNYNYISLIWYGYTLSFYFSNIKIRKHKLSYMLFFMFFLMIQILILNTLGDEFVGKAKPFVTHLPIIFMLKYYYKQSTLMSLISVLLSFQFVTPRRWCGVFVASFFDYDPDISSIVQIIVTIPLIFILTKYVCPNVANLKHESPKVLKIFMLVPIFYYFIELWLTVYTDLLYTGGVEIADFLDASIIVTYTVFSGIYLKTLNDKMDLKVEHAALSIATEHSKTEIKRLRESRQKDAIGRHDLKHHMNYLHSTIKSNKIPEALKYINAIYEQTTLEEEIIYCQDETLNLIFASYIDDAKKKNIECTVEITTLDFSGYSIIDLCSLFSNAITNSINACDKIDNTKKRFLTVKVYTKTSLCINISNSYNEEPSFIDDVPVNLAKNHGYGTKSMVQIIKKYNGAYRFFIDENIFYFQASMFSES